MTELEKCNLGLFYQTDFPGRWEQHLEAADACWEFNRTRPSQLAQRDRILRKLLGSAGEDICIEPTLQCSYGFNLFVGDHFFANNNCMFMDDVPIRFGSHVLIGPNCAFYTARHPLHPLPRREKLERALPITVGDDVWFGGRCTVLPGVTIGDGAVIGAGSVVTRSIPANVIAVGNPCRILRPITSADLDELDRYGARNSTP